MALFKRHKISIDLSRKNSSFSWYYSLLKARNVLLLLCALIALLFAYHYYRKYAELRDVVKNVPAVQNDNPAASVISAVDKLILLPSNEQPIIAQVTNIRLLLGNNFFRNAVVGDDVLVYCKSELSILYSPSRNKIIEVFPQALPEACKSVHY